MDLGSFFILFTHKLRHFKFINFPMLSGNICILFLNNTILSNLIRFHISSGIVVILLTLKSRFFSFVRFNIFVEISFIHSFLIQSFLIQKPEEDKEVMLENFHISSGSFSIFLS